jgi:hypothetical protein
MAFPIDGTRRWRRRAAMVNRRRSHSEHLVITLHWASICGWLPLSEPASHARRSAPASQPRTPRAISTVAAHCERCGLAPTLASVEIDSVEYEVCHCPRCLGLSDLAHAYNCRASLFGKARVAARDDLALGPMRTDLLHDPIKLLDAAGGGIDVGGAQARAQQVLSAEDIQRQIAALRAPECSRPPQFGRRGGRLCGHGL